MPGQNIPTHHDWLTLEPLSATDWLVADEGQRLLTGDGVIGHIQLLFGIYETLKRSEPLARSYYDSLDSAVESFAVLDGSTDALEAA